MAYRRDLELFQDYLEKSSDVFGIYSFMKTKKLSQRSQARMISSIRTYYKFCQRRGDIIPDLSKLRPPRVEVKLPKVLTHEEFKRLQKACEGKDPFRSARNQITLLLLYGLGCRVTELIQVDIEDYHAQEAWVKVLGKGGKERLIPLVGPLQSELDIYLNSVRPHLALEGERSLLVNDRGKRPSRVDLWRWLEAWSRVAGFEKTVSPHQLRHGCATAMLNAGADLRAIQKLLGHVNIQTTQIYTSVSTGKMHETIQEHHPFSNPSQGLED